MKKFTCLILILVLIITSTIYGFADVINVNNEVITPKSGGKKVLDDNAGYYIVHL